MIFDAKKGGVIFLTFLTPPSPPPSLKGSKKWVSSGGVWGGSGPKTHWGMRLLRKIMILQGVKLTIQPLGVGYANSPKKAEMGGVCGVFPYIPLSTEAPFLGFHSPYLLVRYPGKLGERAERG